MTQMPVWLFVITLIIFITIGIAGIVVFFKTQSYKKSVLLRNETLPPAKQIKMKWYQNWGPVFGFLMSVIMALGVMAIVGMYLS